MHTSELITLSTEYLSRIHLLKKEDILPLRELIREHNRLYHELESPVISDTEYDELFHALARAEADYDMLDDDSPTARLAILASEQFQKVKHIYPMISLDNTYSVEDVMDFEERMRRVLKEKSPASFTYYIQPKYDGLWLAVIYRYWVFSQAVTRGSGVEGEDVTLGAYEISSIPKSIASLKNVERMEIRGEVMMSRTTFEQVNRERLQVWEKLFANPRNCASGSLRQIDPLITRSRNLEFFAYAIPQIEQWIDTHTSIQSYHVLMDTLATWWFKRVDFPFIFAYGLGDLTDIIERETHKRKEYFDFDIDGMVLKFDDMTLWDELGRTEHHPRYAIAYKFPAKQVRTRVLSIEHSVGRTGTVTPVANLESVDVTGVTVKRATLHNYDELAKKDVREGDYVFIMRAGEVIPEIVSVISDARTWNEKPVFPPSFCPVCSTPLKKDEGKVAIYCPNSHCPAKILGQLEMFVSKQGMNIDGLWTKQIELFLGLWWIHDFASIFHLHEHRDEFFSLEWYKEKSVNNLLESIEKARNTTLDKVFTAIGIPNVGKKTAKLIANVIYKKHQEGTFLFETITSLTEDELTEVRDIWPETASAFVVYISENSEILKSLISELFLEISSKEKIWNLSWILRGKSFCVTGSFDGVSREDIHALIEWAGWEIRTSVSSKLDYLIVGENAGSKLEKARELSVQVLSFIEFKQLLSVAENI
jgi:DNA ligase (NAD+)